MLSPLLIAERIEKLCLERGTKVARILAEANLDKSVVDRMKSQGSMPSADKVAAIAHVLRVPSEMILGLGIFRDWDLVLENRLSVLSLVSGLMGSLANNLKHGVTDDTLAWLIALFNVTVEIDEYGIPNFGAISPFGLLDFDVEPFRPRNASDDMHYFDEVQELMREFGKLDTRGRRIVWATLYKQQDRVFPADDNEEKKKASLDGEAG